MAHHKSAKKRIRTNARKRVSNKEYRSATRSVVKELKSMVAEVKEGKQNKETAETVLKKAQAKLAKAAQKGIIPKRNASRQISRLTKALASAQPQS